VDNSDRMYLHVAMVPFTKAKLFQHGGSQAVRLPREFRFEGREVRVLKTQRGVLLEPLDSDFEERRRKFIALAGSCPDLDDVPAHDAPDLPRDE
jgi:antitoxin VapB